MKKNDEVQKVPVELNQQADKCFYIDMEMKFEAANQQEAKIMHSRILGFLEGLEIEMLSHTLSVEGEEGTAPIAIFEEGENDADTALRKLTANRGNKLWVDYLQQQLEMARRLK